MLTEGIKFLKLSSSVEGLAVITRMPFETRLFLLISFSTEEDVLITLMKRSRECASSHLKSLVLGYPVTCLELKVQSLHSQEAGDFAVPLQVLSCIWWGT